MLLRTAVFLFFSAALAAVAQPPAPPTSILLWPEGAPGAKGTEEVDKPSLTPYLAPRDKANGAAVLICPGGGYGALAMDHEGKQIAEWLNSLGVSGFILKYRLGQRYRHPAPLDDATRAIRMIRERAQEWGVDPARVGVWGFSAGGHLASTLSTHWQKASGATPSSRPDFSILCYPVITFTDPWMHRGSRRNLLGEPPDAALIENLSNDKQVTSETPPTFLFHTDADSGVPPENSVMYYLALRRAKVPAELHIYERGRHGVGLAPTDAVLSSWPARLADWLRIHGWLDRK